jgi:hypothetical protein
MHRTRSAAILALLASLLVSACAASDPGWPPQQTNFALFPALVSAEVAPGQNRLLFNVLDSETNQSIASPDRALEVKLYDFSTDRTRPAITTPAAYLPTTEGRPGLYRAMVDIARAGQWGAEVTATEADGSKRVGRMVFEVRAQGSTPAIGAAAVASDTPTAASDAEIAQISTDDDPDPDFYTASIADAVAAHKPFAIIFATPAFCASATCAPTLDLVKSVAAEYKPAMSFIHVEPYELEDAGGQLQPVLSAENRPIPVDSVTEWGLPTEPYIFVVDADGKVSAKFEGIASAEELRAAFAAVTS